MGSHAKSFLEKLWYSGSTINWRLWLIRSATGEPRCFFLFEEWIALDDKAGPMDFLGSGGVTQKKFFFQKFTCQHHWKLMALGYQVFKWNTLPNFIVSGVNSCGIKIRSCEVPRERLHVTISFLFQELSFFRSAPVKVDIFGISGQQIQHLTKVVFTTRVTAGECKRNRLWRKRIS